VAEDREASGGHRHDPIRSPAPARPPRTFLSALNPPERAAFVAAGRDRHFADGETIMRQGDPAAGVLAIVSGRVKVSVVGAGGREVVLQFPGSGALIGELATLSGGSRAATVTAVGDVDTLELSAVDFRRFISGHPRVAGLVVEHVTSLLAEADRQLVDMATRDVTGRVAARLLELADQADASSQNTVRISLALTQDELAAWTGASREAVAKALQQLRELGWVQTGRREITVLDRAALRRLVG
jgi:CRP/FNR family transcriptional regulator, cyclic AMP receptor protein